MSPKPTRIDEPKRSTSAVEYMGQLRFFLDLRVSTDELKDWSPLRISQFFEGVAMALRALHDYEGNNPGAVQ